MPVVVPPRLVRACLVLSASVAVVVAATVSAQAPEDDARPITFDAPRPFRADCGSGEGLAGYLVWIADWNGDQRFDLLSVDLLRGTYSLEANFVVCVGRGDGTFSNAALFLDDLGLPAALGDLDGDGVPDLAARTAAGDAPGIRLSSAPSAFAVHQRILPVDAPPIAIHVADLNADGAGDLVLVTARDVVVRLGNGDGTFEAELAIRADVGVRRILDVDGDGALDLIVSGTEELYLARGRGDGTFDALRPIAEAFFEAVEDVDQDGTLDVVARQLTSEGSTLVLVRGRGGGRFAAPIELAALVRSERVAVADFDGDGAVDLLTSPPDCCAAQPQVFLRLRRGRGDGTFASPEDVATLVRDPFPIIEVADLQGDGIPDLVVGRTVYVGNGDGTFQTGVERALTTRFGTLIAADLNADGYPDIVAVGSTETATGEAAVRIDVRLGSRSGLQPGPTMEAPGLRSGGLVRGDFDGDGSPDLALLPVRGAETAGVLLGRGDGTFAAPRPVALGLEAIAVEVADLNGDRLLDLVAIRSPRVSILLGHGDGTFGPANFLEFSREFEVTLVVEGHDLVVADIDQDGAPDLVHAADDGVQVFRGVGDGTFTPAPAIALAPLANVGGELVPQPGSELIVGLDVADLDRDGWPDIVAVTQELQIDWDPFLGHVHVLRNSGAAAFEALEDVLVDNRFNSIDQRLDPPTLADLNGDGVPDLVIRENGRVVIRAGVGDGRFGPGHAWGSGGALVIADMDRDGLLDLVQRSGASLAVLRNTTPVPIHSALGGGLNAVVFRGETGTAVAQWAGELGPEVEAVWAFDHAAQEWRGYFPALPAALQGLTTLTHGAPLFVQWSGESREVVGAPLVVAETVAAPPGFRALVYGGPDGTDVASWLAEQPAIARVFRWDAVDQRWWGWYRGAPAGVSELTSVDRGDVLLVFNQSEAAVEVSWGGG